MEPSSLSPKNETTKNALSVASDEWTAFRKALVAVARKRVAEDDAEDVVQSTLAEALLSAERPEDPDTLRRWIWGILRHKIADHYRKRRREVLGDENEVAGEAPDEATQDLLRWAVARLPKGGDVEETFQWLLREGEGEKLENIAEEVGLPAPRVRKRVSRLRQHLRTHWVKEVAVLAGMGIALALAYFVLRKPVVVDDTQIALPDPKVREQERKRERGIELRREGLLSCARGEDDACIAQLDEAKKLDPAGHDAQAKEALERAIERRDAKLKNEQLNQVVPVPTAKPMIPTDSLSEPPSKMPVPPPTAMIRATAAPLPMPAPKKGKPSLEREPDLSPPRK